MKSLVRISIDDQGEHWHKRIWIFGILIYHRHDFTKNPNPRSVGFTSMPIAPIDIEDEE